MPCLEQTSAITILHLSLSSVIRSKAMLSLLFPVTKELKLSRKFYVILCLPLLLVPSILPVRDKNSSPLWRHMCPKNFSCLFLIVFMRDLSWFVSSNIDSFVLFSFHDILNILLYNHISAASKFFLVSAVIVQVSHPYKSTDHTYVFKTIYLVENDIFLLLRMVLIFWKEAFAMAILFLISILHLHVIDYNLACANKSKVKQNWNL